MPSEPPTITPTSIETTTMPSSDPSINPTEINSLPGDLETNNPTFGTTLGPTAKCDDGIDMVFLLDRTGSMRNTISNLVLTIDAYATKVEEVTLNNYRFGLVSVEAEGHDPLYTLRLAFSDLNKAQLLAQLSLLFAEGGLGAPEPTDLALNTIVRGTIGLGSWRANTNKIVILMTDNPPSGGDDEYTIGVDDVHAHNIAIDASSQHIRIISIQVGPSNPSAADVMTGYVTTTAGQYAYSQSGVVSDAIIDALSILCTSDTTNNGKIGANASNLDNISVIL
jgi:hypothetical protein